MAFRVFGAASRIDPSSGSDYTIRRVTGWVRKCIEGHPHCTENTSRRLPTRVIDVSVRKVPDGVFLYESEGGNSRYTALSHCWGKIQIITTTKATIEQMKQGIPWASLSRTFQDAITITRQLGVQYIWIDSLCIVQDDKHDWEVESATMAAVYENSYLTIAASLAADGSGGCFSIREITTHLAGSLNDAAESGSCSVYVRESFSHDEFSSDIKDTATLSNPLLGRAWTFQERALSTRILHFGRSELLWECRTMKDCECGRYKSMASFGNIARSLAEVLERASSSDDVSDDVLEDVRLHWQNILKSYSTMKLTVSTDQLPAISAIVSQFDKVEVAGIYLAGLWSCHLPTGLLWKVPKVSRPTITGTLDDNNNAYTAPTWSWASLHDAGVEYSEDLIKSQLYVSDSRTNAHIIDFGCIASGANPFGEVTSGAHITMAATATWATTVRFTDRKAALEAINEVVGRDWEYGRNWPWKLEKRSILSSSAGGGDGDDVQCTRAVDYLPDQGRIQPIATAKSSSSLLTTATRVLCLKVLTTRRTIFALVLQPLPGADEYHRVGLLEMLRAEENGEWGGSWHWFDDGAEEMVVKVL